MTVIGTERGAAPVEQVALALGAPGQIPVPIDDANALPVKIISGAPGGGSGSADREFLITTYKAVAAFSGASVGDVITAVRMMDVSGASASQVGATVWRNETTQSVIPVAPNASDLEPAVGGGGTSADGLTNLQLREQAVDVNLTGGGATEYTEDAALPTNPKGAVLMVRRRDTPAAEVSNDGDAVAANANALGAIYVADIDNKAVLNTIAAAVAAQLSVVTRDGFFTTEQTFARPSTDLTYGANAAVLPNPAAAIEIPNVIRGLNEGARIEQISLRKSTTNLVNASFRIHLFRTEPTLSTGIVDGSAFSSSSGQVVKVTSVAGYAGSIDITMDKAGDAGARGTGAPANGRGLTLKSTTAGKPTSIWAIVETLGAYISGNGEQFTLTVEGARP